MPQTERWSLIKSNLQVIRLKSLGKEWLSAPSTFQLVCINPKPPSFIIGKTDIDVLSSHPPTSPPIAPVLNAGAEMTAACKIPLNLFAIKLMLNFINSNLTVDQVDGPVEGAVYFLQHPSPILAGSSLLQISIFYFWSLCIDPPSSGLPTSLPIPSALNAEVMPPGQYSDKYNLGLLKCDRPCRVLNKCSSWHYTQCEYSP